MSFEKYQLSRNLVDPHLLVIKPLSKNITAAELKGEICRKENCPIYFNSVILGRELVCLCPETKDSDHAEFPCCRKDVQQKHSISARTKFKLNF